MNDKKKSVDSDSITDFFMALTLYILLLGMFGLTIFIDIKLDHDFYAIEDDTNSIINMEKKLSADKRYGFKRCTQYFEYYNYDKNKTYNIELHLKNKASGQIIDKIVYGLKPKQSRNGSIAFDVFLKEEYCHNDNYELEFEFPK